MEATAKHSAQTFRVFLMMLLRSIELPGHRLAKQEDYSAKTEDWFARRNFLVRAVDVSVFAEVALGSLCDGGAAALEF